MIPTIDVFFEFASPYSYLAADRNVGFVPFRSLPDATLARLAVHRLNRRAPEAAEPFVLATWRKLFAQGGEIGSIEALTRGLEARLQSKIQSAQGDAQAAEDLEIATREAVALGCFGVPWTVAAGG